MNHLLRGHAPLTDSNWKLLDEEAVERLAGAAGGASPGRLHRAEGLGALGHQPRSGRGGRRPEEGVKALRRRVLPLVEVRVDFTVSRAEMRDDDRGAVDVDLASLDDAAHQIAVAENSAIFNGWAKAGIAGVIEASPFEPEPLGGRADDYPARSPARSRRCARRGSRGPTAWRSVPTSTSR